MVQNGALSSDCGTLDTYTRLNEAHEENDHHDDDGQDDDVKLRPGHYCQGRGRAVVS